MASQLFTKVRSPPRAELRRWAVALLLAVMIEGGLVGLVLMLAPGRAKEVPAPVTHKAKKLVAVMFHARKASVGDEAGAVVKPASLRVDEPGGAVKPASLKITGDGSAGGETVRANASAMEQVTPSKSARTKVATGDRTVADDAARAAEVELTAAKAGAALNARAISASSAEAGAVNAGDTGEGVNAGNQVDPDAVVRSVNTGDVSGSSGGAAHELAGGLNTGDVSGSSGGAARELAGGLNTDDVTGSSGGAPREFAADVNPGDESGSSSRGAAGELQGRDLSRYGVLVLSELTANKRYPLQARRLRLQGTAVVELRIGADGGLLRATLVSTSGHEVLDADALTLIRASAPFPPTPGSVPAVFTVPIRYGG